MKKIRVFKKNEEGKVIVKDGMDFIKQEIEIMKNLNHPYIVDLFEVIDDPDGNFVIFVMEYLRNGQLIEWNEDSESFDVQYPDDLVVDFFFIKRVIRDCLKSLNYLHNNGIVHRDIKP